MKRLVLLLPFCSVLLMGQPLSIDDASFIKTTSILRRGIVACWMLEESTGTRFDRSKNGNHLTSNNSVGVAAGLLGNAATFVDTSSQYLSITDNSSLRIQTSDFTISLWFYTTNAAGNQTLISKRETSQEWTLKSNGAKVQFFVFPDSTNLITTGNIVTNNAWYHVLVRHTLSTKTLSLSVNNTPVADTNYLVSITSGAAPVKVAAQLSPAQQFFSGMIDEVELWNRRLSDAECTFIYNSRKGVHYPWVNK